MVYSMPISLGLAGENHEGRNHVPYCLPVPPVFGIKEELKKYLLSE